MHTYIHTYIHKEYIHVHVDLYNPTGIQKEIIQMCSIYEIHRLYHHIMCQQVTLVHICIYMYVYIYTYTYKYIYICAYINVYIYIYIYIYMCIYTAQAGCRRKSHKCAIVMKYICYISVLCVINSP